MAANGNPHEEQTKAIHEFYGDDIDFSLLFVRLQSLSSFFAWRKGITLAYCVAEIRSITTTQQSFFSEVCSLIRLVLLMPATNAVSEQSFSAMRRLNFLALFLATFLLSSLLLFLCTFLLSSLLLFLPSSLLLFLHTRTVYFLAKFLATFLAYVLS